MSPKFTDLALRREIELDRIAPPAECERLSGADWDTLRRRHPDKVIQISPRRVGMRVRHALMLEDKPV
jgi:hypothetical protein